MNRIVIVGGGASGLTAAIFAARAGAEVTVIERENKPLKKLAQTGNGKCNLTNLSIEEDSFRSYCPGLARAVYERFGMTETFSYFERMGILIIRKEEGRAYPACESAPQVAKILLSEAEHLGVRFKNNENVKTIVAMPDGTFKAVTETWHYEADKLILSCGTNASVKTTDEVLAERVAVKFGLRSHPYLPALTRLYGKGNYLKTWAGVRVFAVLKMFCDGEYVSENFGELQLTETGISGIPVFDLSRYVNIMIKNGSNVSMKIDFFPDCDEASLLNAIRKIMANAPYKTIQQAFYGILPEKLVHSIIPKESDEQTAVHIVKEFDFPVTSLSRIEESQVCTGGIDLTEVTQDLEVKKIPGLFITGEALDVDGGCGGYNLQWAWSSGALAGICAAKEK